MLHFLRKNYLFINLKKYRFYNSKDCFFKYIILAQKIKIENKTIKVIKKWPYNWPT